MYVINENAFGGEFPICEVKSVAGFVGGTSDHLKFLFYWTKSIYSQIMLRDLFQLESMNTEMYFFDGSWYIEYSLLDKFEYTI